MTLAVLHSQNSGRPSGSRSWRTPLHDRYWYTFRFADDRIILRFRLEGVEAGWQVSVFKIDPQTGERLAGYLHPRRGLRARSRRRRPVGLIVDRSQTP